MVQLPPGVTLQQIDGGPTYYADHGFTNAVSMGWDSPNFFPIGPFDSSYNSQTDVNTWSALGWNTDFADGGVNLSLAASHGISVIEQNYAGSLPSNVVGLLTQDEPSTFAEGVFTPLSTTANSIQAGRFWWMNDTWSWAWGQGLSGAPAPGTPASILSDLVTTPNGTTRHIDINSIDMYWFAGSRDPSWSGYMTSAGQYLYNLSSGMTPDQSERGSNYGDMIDILRSYQAGGHPAPIYSIIEDGDPFTGSTNGSTYITPAELNWATWSSLIHGARGIIYFDHSFSGPGTGDVNVEQSYYQTVQPGQTISIYNQIKATDALVEQLAPVLNSPFALHYVTVSPAGYTYSTPTLSLSGGIEVMAKDDNGQFYIFADTRDSETQHNIPAVFTLNDPNATSVTVVNENRTISVVNGSFSDTFANASTVHIYQVNDSGTPPPAPPSAPTITAFSPDTNGQDTTSRTLVISGKATDGTVTLLDGSTTVGTAVVTSGAWSITENNAANGTHVFNATDTDANGTSSASPPFNVTVNVLSPPPPPPGNLVANPGFETGDFSGWTLSGNVSVLSAGPQAFITTVAHSGNYAAGMGSVGSDGILSQNLTTTAGQSYTFDFWLANVGGNPNDFTAKIGGVTEMHFVNQSAQGYTHYVFDFTASGSTTPIEFDFRQDPSEWHLDDVSVVAGAAKSGLTVVGSGNNVTLTNPSGTTSDILIGNGGGNDIFVFSGAAFGNDQVVGFRLGTNHDILQFDHTVFSSFSAVKAHAAQVGSNTVITVDAHDSVTLVGTSLSHLQAADFHFV